MREEEKPKKFTLDDTIKGILPFLLIGGTSVGGYGVHVLSTRIDAEREARAVLERRLELIETRLSNRIDRVEDRINR